VNLERDVEGGCVQGSWTHYRPLEQRNRHYTFVGTMTEPEKSARAERDRVHHSGAVGQASCEPRLADLLRGRPAPHGDQTADGTQGGPC